MPETIVACSLGRLDYREAWALQQRLQARLIAAKRQHPPAALPHVVLLVEHPHVYTLGKNGDPMNLLRTEAELAAVGATFVPIDRGGDITYHGPGQLVGYPILDLDRFFTDIHRYLRTLEAIIIDTCAGYGVTGRPVEKRTGVWVGPDDRGLERKICAMGIRCSRWVTMHGFALNVNTDLSYFDHIVPCGITDRGITSLAEETGHPVEDADVRSRVLDHFAQHFAAEVIRLAGTEAEAFLTEFSQLEAA